MSNNRTRILAEAVSLDAWHDPFVTGDGVAVYVELSFQQGRLGGDHIDLPFTFKLGLKRALLTVSLEKPLEISRPSVARSTPETAVEFSRIIAAKRSAESALAGKAAISPAALHVALSGSSKFASEVSQADQMKIVQTIPETIVTPQPVDAHAYSWSIEPSWQPILNGQPWDPVSKPRFRTKSIGALNAIEPVIKAELSCALEDISISDIKRKAGSNILQTIEIGLSPVNIAAAQQYLKLVLRDADIEPGSLDNRFSSLLLASVLAAAE